MLRLLYYDTVVRLRHLPGLMICFVLLPSVFVFSAGISHSEEATTKTASSGYVYPMQLVCGALNTLSGISRTDAQVAIEMNFDRLSNSLNPDFHVSIEFLKDVNSAVSLIRQQKLHVLVITGIDYLLLSKMTAVTPLVVASKSTSSPLESYVLLTRKGITLNDLISMKRRRLVVDSKNPWDIGRIWLETALHQKELSPMDQSFTTIQVAKKPIRTVLPVFFGHADACLVLKSAYDTMVDLNPQIGQQLHVLMQSPGFIKNLICIVDDLDPKLVSEMDATLRDMHTTEEGGQVLVIFQLRRNYPFKPEYLTETERVFNRYRKMNPESKVP